MIVAGRVAGIYLVRVQKFVIGKVLRRVAALEWVKRRIPTIDPK